MFLWIALRSLWSCCLCYLYHEAKSFQLSHTITFCELLSFADCYSQSIITTSAVLQMVYHFLCLSVFWDKVQQAWGTGRRAERNRWGVYLDKAVVAGLRTGISEPFINVRKTPQKLSLHLREAKLPVSLQWKATYLC